MEPTLPLRFHFMREIFMSSVATTIPHRTTPRRQRLGADKPWLQRTDGAGHAQQGHAQSNAPRPCAVRLPAYTGSCGSCTGKAMQAPHTEPCGQPTGQSIGCCEPLAACAQVHFGAGEARPRLVQWTRHGRCEPLVARDQAQSGKNRPRRGTASVTRDRAPVRASPGRRAPRRGHAAAVPRLGCGQLPAWARMLGRQRADA